MKILIIKLLYVFLLTVNICSTSKDNCENFIFSPTKENVKIIGRFYQHKDITWLIQSGSAIEFYVNGFSAKVILIGGSSINTIPNYRPRFGVYVDDEIIFDSTMSEPELPVELFKGSSEKKAKIKVMFLSEAITGGIGIKAININSCDKNPIKPSEKKKLNIEFIGDSIMAGYGVEAKNQFEHFQTSTENFSKTYAYLTAKNLDADYYGVIYSGYGVVSGHSRGEKGEKNTQSMISNAYTKISKYPDFPGEWDFENHPIDVIVINFGTNDNSYIIFDPEKRSEEFVEEYYNFLRLVRGKNPESYIICTLGMMGRENLYPFIDKAIKLVGDNKISSYESNIRSVNFGFGADYHPSSKTHIYNSYVLTDKICNILGLEFNQIKLEAVSFSVYDVKKNEEKGVNISFIIGKDKSFWINTIIGGKEPMDIEAKCSGIQLEKGGVYVLEFEYISTKEEKIPVIIRGKKEYFKDSIKSTLTKVKYFGEVNIDENDDDAAIIYQLGGLDNFGFTLVNIKLTKINKFNK